MAENTTSGSTQLLPIPVSGEAKQQHRVADESAVWETLRLALFGVLLVLFWSYLLVQVMVWVSGS